MGVCPVTSGLSETRAAWLGEEPLGTQHPATLLLFLSVSLSPLCRQIIRKVAKQCALLDVDEPISQLHKCAFQFPSDTPGGAGTYLCLATEKVVRFQVRSKDYQASQAEHSHRIDLPHEGCFLRE